MVPIGGKRIKCGERVAEKTGNLSRNLAGCVVKDGLAVCEQEKRRSTGGGNARARSSPSNPVVIRSMGETIYPSLTPMGFVRNDESPETTSRIDRGGQPSCAAVIAGTSYGGKVDCIYIDPPYNTGARNRDGSNNDYVDDKDAGSTANG